ncbi:hypothetical protein Fmac_003623 [Flemingia macrophylla]|uniref:Homologous recombination OB-fold protein OB-fold domain-containing protein n=1 Tax=Flemingia macrophylla TaxID=520843 RepID=A0ABD1N2U6_9FABA
MHPSKLLTAAPPTTAATPPSPVSASSLAYELPCSVDHFCDAAASILHIPLSHAGEDNNRMLQGWKGRLLFASSCWVPAQKRKIQKGLIKISSSVIPGPAGAVQAVMRNRGRLTTQECLRRIDSESDHHFSGNPWLCALQFVRSRGDDVAPLSSINERVPLVVVLVKSCTPNGFGDMMVTVKDPTSTVGASVHRKVLAHAEFGKDISVGSVLVLEKVAVFSPSRSISFLNIMLNNVVKVFAKDSGPPSDQVMYPALPVLRTTPTIDIHETPGSSPFSMPQGRTEGIMSNLRINSSFKQVAGSHNDNGSEQNQEPVLEGGNSTPSLDNAGPLEVNHGGELEIEMEDQSDPPKLEGDSLAWISQGNRSTTNSVHTSQGEKIERENHLEREKQMVNQRSSIPSWTEEQLDELLAFD